jgi:hypothetical protein
MWKLLGNLKKILILLFHLHRFWFLWSREGVSGNCIFHISLVFSMSSQFNKLLRLGCYESKEVREGGLRPGGLGERGEN